MKKEKATLPARRELGGRIVIPDPVDERQITGQRAHGRGWVNRPPAVRVRSCLHEKVEVMLRAQFAMLSGGGATRGSLVG